MKNILLLVIVLFSLSTYSQDTTSVKQIDSLVKLINNSGLKIQRDTLRQEYPAMNLSMQTYLSMLTDAGELKKYVNDVHMSTKENGVPKKQHGITTFYFDHNKLIKVEDDITEGDKKLKVDWYFSNDKPIYNTLKSDKGQDRADLLLKIAEGMLQTMKVKRPG